MATLLSDNFDRANSTTAIGSPQIGPAPTIVSGVGGISSNQVYCSTATLVAVYDLGTPNVELSATCNTLTTANGVGLILGSASTTDSYVFYVSTTVVVLYRAVPGGLAQLCTSSIKFPAASGSVIRAHYRDGVIRGYVDDVFVLRWGLDAPITSNLHGIRMANTTTRMDNLLGTDAPLISDDKASGGLQDNARYISGATNTESSSAYLGRDTFIQDQAAGA